jgi:outer membrane protein OmpA-like peptidoglycan-associated protein
MRHLTKRIGFLLVLWPALATAQDAGGSPDAGIGGTARPWPSSRHFVIAEKVLFGDRSAKIEPAMAKLLDDIASRLKSKGYLVRIEGHTDNAGNSQFRQRISQQRADAVRDYLVKQGVEAGRLQSVAYGAMRPIDTNATKEGRAKNRRVELIVVD